MALILAGDVGGTKTLLSLFDVQPAQPPRLRLEQRYASADWAELEAMVNRFLDDAAAAGHGRPEAACFAVAGPVQGGGATLTNLPWRLDETALAHACGMAAISLVNDFAVLIYGLPHLQAHQQSGLYAGTADPGAPVLVLGAGTGLGVAIGVPTAQGLLALASEGSHGEFAPRNPDDWELKRWLMQDLGLERLSIERVVSGTGLGHVARWLLAAADADPAHPLQDSARRWLMAGPAADDLPARVAAMAADGDPLCRRALEVWLAAYGAVCGDLALTTLPRGGIWLAGGTAAKLLQALASAPFRNAMLDKGRLAAVLDDIPVTAITDPGIGSFSAACRAQQLLA